MQYITPLMTIFLIIFVIVFISILMHKEDIPAEESLDIGIEDNKEELKAPKLIWIKTNSTADKYKGTLDGKKVYTISKIDSSKYVLRDVATGYKKIYTRSHAAKKHAQSLVDKAYLSKK